MMRRTTIAITTASAAVVVVGLAVGVHATVATASRPHAAIEKVTTVGDSIMAGSGLSPTSAWPDLVAADEHVDLTNLGCGSAGFLAVGGGEQCASNYDGLVDYTAATHPDVIVVQGSSNDLGQDDTALAAKTTATIEDLHEAAPHARIIGLSSVWNEKTPPAQLAIIDAQVHSAVAAADGTYVDIGDPLEGHGEYMQADDVHPNARGQRALADAITTALHRDHVRL